MQVYHGSNIIIENPVIQITGFYKDFGFGFYCTVLEKQAQRWALNKTPEHIVNCYDYSPDHQLNSKVFESMTEEWLDFIIDCRQGIPHTFDIVEGPMADDTIWNYIEDFLTGTITREAFWILAKFKHPTHQIVFCTPDALTTLTYERSYVL